MNAAYIDRIFVFFLLYHYYEFEGFDNLEKILNEPLDSIFNTLVPVVTRSF
jgi:hypothetical protein